jgi:FixJ family two-component response regulator
VSQPVRVLVVDDDQVLRAGASGFLLKDTPPAAIIEAVRRVAAGDPMLSPTVTGQLIAHVAAVDRRTPGESRTGRARARLDQLSDREREVALARPQPAVLRAVADHQPITPVIETVRGLLAESVAFLSWAFRRRGRC